MAEQEPLSLPVDGGKMSIERGADYTFPEDRGVCGFCGEEENGYALRDKDGKFQPATPLIIKKNFFNILF